MHKSIIHPANQREADGRQTKILVPEKERERQTERGLMMNQCWLAADCLADPCWEELQH